MIAGLSVPVILLVLVQAIEAKNNRKERKNSASREEELRKEIERLKKEKDDSSKE